MAARLVEEGIGWYVTDTDYEETVNHTAGEAQPGTAQRRAVQQGEWLASRLVDSALQRRLGVTVEWWDPRTPVLRVSNRVGHIRFADPDRNVHLNLSIRPKVPGSVAGLLRAVLWLTRDQPLILEERPTAPALYPSAWLASVYVYELERFLALVRPRGQEVEEELVGRVKGRWLVEPYLQRNYLTRRHVVPCRYVEWTPDNLPNRILRYALWLSRQVLGRSLISAALELGTARRCDAALSEVELVRMQWGDLVRVRPLLQGAFLPYRPIIGLAGLVISSLDPFAFKRWEVEDLEDMPVVRAFDAGSSDDRKVRWDLVDMPVLFEEYVRRITRGMPVKRRRFPIRLEGAPPLALRQLLDTSMKLDREPIQAGAEAKLVLDAKYKLVGETTIDSPWMDKNTQTLHLGENQVYNLADGHKPDSKAETTRVSNADLYQVIAYATHKDVCASASALVYPVVGAVAGPEPPRYTGLGFCHCQLPDNGIPVYILLARIDDEGIREEVGGRGILRDIEKILSRGSSDSPNQEPGMSVVGESATLVSF